MSLLPASLRRMFSKAFSLAGKEVAALEELHQESKATVRQMTEADPGLRGVLEKAYGYAVFPSVGKATAVIGGAFGKGEVFRGNDLIGYAGLVQVTLGVQVGGQTFSEIVAFENEDALKRFQAGKTRFAANASAVLVKAGAAASSNYDAGAVVFVSSEGGMMLEAAIGAQKFVFKPAALGRIESAPTTKRSTSRRKSSARAKARRPAKRSKNPGKASKSRGATERPPARAKRAHAAKSASRRRAAKSGS